MSQNAVLARLRNAAAQGRLVIISGAGISGGLSRVDGSTLPNWTKLVAELRKAADETRLSPADRQLLDILMPAAARSLHGDTLIEASEILRRAFDPGKFERKIASLCRERKGETSEAHRAIASIAPAGVITFNYDRAHETAFREQSLDFESVLYSNDRRIKALLARRRSGPLFLLKAHGTITDPESLVLTSSSYRDVLSRCRPYRVLLQYALVHYTVLIVGFALRDRDFDHLLGTLEVELGKPEQRHVFIALRPAATPEGLAEQASWAALTARFGVDPLYVDDFPQIPPLIRSIGEEPGPLIRQLVRRARSPVKAVREAVHDEIKMLGEIGRRQLRAALLEAIAGTADPLRRSELVYALGGVADGEFEVARRLADEVVAAARDFGARQDLGPTELAAHALLVLRRIRLPDPVQRTRIVDLFSAPAVRRQLAEMDVFVAGQNEVPRLVAYADAAAAEIEARARA